MTTPVSPEVADAAVQAQLGQQAASLAPPEGTPQAEVAQNLVAAGAAPAEVDTAALLARLQNQVAELQAAADQAKAASEPKDASLAEVILHGNLPAAIAHALTIIENRLASLEGK